ncbi:MAG: DUF2079 domain-containing protein [Candidatus Dormibacteraeota bacterium]|uniref:DUF2079 domain-containing protein n=1 Tax=Candidatus Dormiibacter inghamiae TaxID=3127013 RepID=A0A934NBC0_9BACT|nr:DUF2079 domain-containing protein [Candidatus Dormibacteraeota bacterium]MBJ7604909.1 DUF2079 domain-containing protein [Candidatus Dormibacteraeota bacterium]
MGAAWAALLALFSNLRLERLSIPAFDTAYFQQLVWGLSHGHPFQASFLQGSFLGLHFSPILALAALLELAVPGAQALTLASAAALGLVAPTAFLACREILPKTPGGTGLAVVLATVLPFTPPLQEAAWSGFHPEELALPALFLATWAMLSGRRVLALPLIGLALLAKEDQAYQVAVLGILSAADRGHRRIGLLIAGGAVLWGVVLLLLLMPWFRQGLVTDTATYYSWLTVGGPGATFSSERLSEVGLSLLQPQAWRALGLTLLALCLLPLLRPGFTTLAAPPLLVALLSRHQPQPQLQLQYALPLVFPLVLAAALGGKRLLQVWQPRPVALAGAVMPGLVVALTGSLVLPLFAYIERPEPSELGDVKAAMALVPAGAELDADDDLAAAVASRRELHLLPHTSPTAFVLVDAAARIPAYSDRQARNRSVAALPLDRRLLWTNGRLQLWSPAASDGWQTRGNQQPVGGLLPPIMRPVDPSPTDSG